MQSSQRAEYNFALTYAIIKANRLNKPLVAFFGVTPSFPEANLRHYHFMLDGLQETSNSLQEIGVKLAIRNKSPERGAVELSKDSCLTVVDKGYLKTLKQWYRSVAENVECPLIQVEDNVVVPLEEASGKEEYSAAILRPKIANNRPRFLSKLIKTKPTRDSLSLEIGSLDLKDITRITSALHIDDSVEKTKHYKGGASEATKRLENFIEDKLPDYPELRNDPTIDCQSNLSPYLHFGQISPIYTALKILDANASAASKEAFLEELIVRRELAVNYVQYNENYDCFAGLPDWAKRTLWSHESDPRQYLYSLSELENAKTHDPYWNAAQNQMRVTGKMHGYMRMYWGKKLIEWSETPEIAFNTALHLNNKYELDGRDPNGFAGVAWCFGKHDRPWKERPVFGNVRYMNENGLRRKFDADKYIEKVKQL
jgi:deoxyribodipyrimidine photo-lyase